MERSGVVKDVADQLSRIFRHLMPGVLIVAAARASHPRWFADRLDPAGPWSLALLAVIALLAGNTWYVVHRYTLHQFLSLLFHRRRSGAFRGYFAWRAKHVHDGNTFPEHARELREHVMLRSSQVIYLFILAEAVIFFALAPAQATFFSKYQLWLLLGGAALVPFAWWQYWLTAHIDQYAVTQYGGKRVGKAAQREDAADEGADTSNGPLRS